MTLSQTPSGIRQRYFLPILLPFRLGAKGCLILPLNWYPHFLDQSYAPGRVCVSSSFVESISIRRRNCLHSAIPDTQRYISSWDWTRTNEPFSSRRLLSLRPASTTHMDTTAFREHSRAAVVVGLVLVGISSVIKLSFEKRKL